MFVITLELEHRLGTDKADAANGAYAVCWVNFPLQDGAEHLAKFYVEQAGWLPKQIESVSVVDEAYYDTSYTGAERDELKGYYSEAKADGVCVVLYEWQPDAEDSDDN